MSRSHGRATAQNFKGFAQILENCVRKLKNYAFQPIFHTYYVILGVTFALFLAQNFKTKVLTAHKNLLLECVL